MLTQIDRDLWTADGPAVPFLGIPYPTRMTIVRLPEGGLWVCSPIRLDAELERGVEALGAVAHLVSPNKIHHLFLGDWQRRWPQARLYASPGLARRRRDLRFDAELGDEPDSAWAATIDQVVFRGSFAMEEVVFFHRPSRTAVVTDLVQRFAAGSVGGWQGWFLRLDDLVGAEGSTPREWRLTFLRRAAARRARAKVLGWDPERLIVAHGECAPARAREILERALRWMG